MPGAVVQPFPYLELFEEGIRQEDEVIGVDQADLAQDGEADGEEEPVARDERDAADPVRQVRHLACPGVLTPSGAGLEV